MLEFNSPCFLGSPANSPTRKTHELQNFSVVRDAEDKLIGIAVSDTEVKGPVLQVSADPLTKRLWLQTVDAFFFIPQAELPEDVVKTLTSACKARSEIKVYSLPVDEDPPERPAP